MTIWDMWRRWGSLPDEDLSSNRAQGARAAVSFAASLELVREGVLEIRQTDAFAPLYMRHTETKPVKTAQG